MNPNYDFPGGPAGNELYMIVSRSGRILQVAPALTANLGQDPLGRNLNDLFPDDLAARLILYTTADNVYEFECTLAGLGYRGGSRLSESSSIIIVLAPVASEDPGISMTDLTRYLCREISSNLSALYMVLHAAEQSGAPESTLGIFRQSLYDLTRISKTAASCADLSEGIHFADIQNADLAQDVPDLLERARIQCGIYAELHIDTSAMTEPVPASIDRTALHRILLNLISWLLDSSPRNKPLLRIKAECRDHALVVQMQTRGSRLPERQPLQSPAGQSLPGQHIELDLASRLTRQLDGTLVNADREDGSLTCRLSIPILPAGSRKLNSLQIDWYGGQDIVKVELAGVLPPEAYEKHSS